MAQFLAQAGGLEWTMTSSSNPQDVT